MSLQRRVHRWLGIESMNNNIQDLRVELAVLDNKLLEPLNAVASVLLSTDSESRKQLSSQLGDKAVADMIADAQARRHTLGEI